MRANSMVYEDAMFRTRDLVHNFSEDSVSCMVGGEKWRKWEVGTL